MFQADIFYENNHDLGHTKSLVFSNLHRQAQQNNK
jgi:hypothetical protein